MIQSHNCLEMATMCVQKVKGASLTMASLNTFLAETMSAIVLKLESEDGARRARASHILRDQSLARATSAHGASRAR